MEFKKQIKMSHQSTQPHTQTKETNWPLIILSILAVAVLIFAITYFVGKRGDNYGNEDEEDGDIDIDVDGNNDASGGLSGGTVPAGSGSSEYNCDADTYNRDDFSTRAEAQTVYDACSNDGLGDIHNLDNDDDGLVC